jgi:hypothetical protein
VGQKEQSLGKIEILVPVAEANFEEIRTAERPSNLDEKVIGLMWDGKPNGDLLLNHVGEALEKKFLLSEILMKSKPRASSRAPDEVLEELSTKCNLVILAIGD